MDAMVVPEPDRGATDLVIAEDRQIVLAFFTGMAIGRFNPVDHSLVEWASETSPDSLVLTEVGLFYTLPF
jgi:hypothetical protein